MNKFFFKLLFTVILFVFIYNPPLKTLPMNSGIIIGGLFFVYYFFLFAGKILSGKQVYFDRNLLIIYFGFAFISFYSFFIAFAFGTNDYQVFKSYLSFLLFYIPGSIGIVKLVNEKGLLSEMIDMIIIVALIQSLIILASLFNINLKEAIFSIVKDTELRVEKNGASGGFRFLGLAYGTTWDLAIVQSVGMMLIALKCKLDSAHINVKNVIYFFILAVSVFLSARTGFLGIIFAILIFILPVNLVEIPFAKFFKFLGRSIIVLAIIFTLLKSSVPAPVVELVESRVIPFAFEMFIASDGGKIETTSSNDLKTMYFSPSLKTGLIGDARYVSPYDSTHYYMETDAGYMRHLLFYGVVGCLVVMILYIIIFYQMIQFSGFIDQSPIVKVFVVFLGAYYFIAHIKGDLFLGADMPIKLMFLLYATFLFYKKSKKLGNESV